MVTIIGIVVGVSFPAVNSGLSGVRLQSAAGSVAILLTSSMNRVDRHEQGAVIVVSSKDNTLAVYTSSSGEKPERTLAMPQGINIEGTEDEAPRRYLFQPGGTILRMVVVLRNDKGAGAFNPSGPGNRHPAYTPRTSTRSKQQAGVTLLEVRVATTIMGIAVAGLIAGLSQSVRNASRLTDYDRAAMLARTRMNDLILDPGAPLHRNRYRRVRSGAVRRRRQRLARHRCGLLNPSQMPWPGSIVLQEVALEIWWQPASSVKSPGTRRTMKLAGYRSATIPKPPIP